MTGKTKNPLHYIEEASVRTAFLVTVCAIIVTIAACSGGPADFTAGNLGLRIDKRGAVSAITDTKTKAGYIYEGEASPLLALRIGGVITAPDAMRYDAKTGGMKLSYGTVTATVSVEVKKTHIVFELVSVEPAGAADIALWGPYRTTVKGTIGETVGVVRNGTFAFGIQSLNPKTIGGYPNEESDVMPSYNIFDENDYSDIGADKDNKVLYRGDTAKLADYGSDVQAYCRDRSRERVIANWSHDRYVAPAFDDGGIIGSKIALFGCPPGEALATIGAIETAEGLPHPMIDGEWGKTAPKATASYIIMPFGKDTIGAAIAITKQAGLEYLYHPDPFASWGHFTLKPEFFPDGTASLKQCVDAAGAEGVRLGVHTLSDFITTNDAYVTPVPDTRLARVGSSTLSAGIGPEAKDIPVEDPGFFNQMKNNTLKTVVIGGELIRYGTVTEVQPWALTDCERGAFGTAAAAHAKGETVGKLIDHPYRVFLADADLQKEMAERIADLFNETGLMQISFDGLEGCWASGMGQYARTLFPLNWYNRLSDELRGKVINDASNPGHYFWHIYTRMNWGEPWYAGFRESQTRYRLMNQEFYRRNLMPRMLGWFRLAGDTSVEDIEWLLARAAGFDAGFSLFTGFREVKDNGRMDEILASVKLWENARLSGAFSDEQKERLKNIDNEFHLEAGEGGGLVLYPVAVSRFTHEMKIRQPGEPVHTVHRFENPYDGKTLGVIVTASGGTVKNISLDIDGARTVSLPVTLADGEHLVYYGGDKAVVYSKNYAVKKTLPVGEASFRLPRGERSVTFDCMFAGGEKPAAKVELRMTGEGERAGGR